ncbi:MAG TPA: DUF4424 family protein [Chitinivibrionales bacterium]|nr:DUF4424 family protein [Chitinivibrionales bacterium]
MIRALSVIAIFLLLAPARNFAGNIDFVKENIFISLVLPDTMCVKGEYFFASTDGSAIHTTVMYPFPVDSSINFPCLIRVRDKAGPVAFQSNPGQAMILIPVSIAKNDTGKTTVVYRQKLKKNSGRYILTTTQTWRKPLGNSNYFITVPSHAILNFLSYESDSVFTRKDSTVYFFSKKVFMPTKDLVFSFCRR